MKINSSFNSGKQLNSILQNQKKTFDKLASGKRINSAADDPAGLAIAEALKTAVNTLGQASRNIGDVNSAAQIKESALNEIGNISSRLNELATQSANGTLSDTQRSALQQEFSALTQEVQRISQTTQFNGKNLLDGSSISAQVGTDSSADSQIVLQGTDVSTAILNVASQNISTSEGAKNALSSISNFSNEITSARGDIGAGVRRLEVASNSIAVERENSAAAESRIRDADIAQSVADKVRNDILSQSNTALQAQSKISAQNVLKLLA